MRFSSLFTGRLRSLLLSLAILIGFACGPSTSDINEFMSFFMPESSQASVRDQVYHFTPLLYRYADSFGPAKDSLQPDPNVLAWETYTQKKVTQTAIVNALYNRDTKASNELVRWATASNPAALTYLNLAWRAEEAAPKPRNSWEMDATPQDTSTVRLTALLNEARAGYAATQDGFLKERYAFQAVKLAALAKKYEQSRVLYDELVRPLSKKTFLSDWAYSRHAGATMAVGDTARAIYEFAQVFDRCPSRRREAEASLRIYGIRFREKALDYCANNHEKAAVYALCAIQPKQDALPFLKEMVRLNPENPLIELVMAREINRNEYYFFQDGAPLYGYDETSRADSLRFVNRQKEAPDYFEQLRSFALESAETKALKNPAFWYTATAYLDYLGKAYADAKKHLDLASQQPTTNPVLKKQIALQQMLLLTAQTETITPEAENQLIGYLEQFGNSLNFYMTNAFVETCKQWAAKYGYGKAAAKESGGFLAGCFRSKPAQSNGPNTAKAFLLTALTSSQLNKNEIYFNSHSDLYDIEDTTSAATVRQVVAFATNANQTDFDKRLLRLSGFTSDALHVLLGRRLLAENKYAEAAEAFANVNANVWQNEPFKTYFNEDPFAVNLIGKKTGTNTTNPYTPVTFLKKLVELESQAKNASGDAAAHLYYQLGCGTFNLSWFGNAWILERARWSRSEPNLYQYTYHQVQNPQRNQALDSLSKQDYYTTAAAKAYFEKAISAAQNPELAAKACFMAARCEQNAFWTRQETELARRGYATDPEPFNAEMKKLRRSEYTSFLSKLAQQYRQTQFHRDMIRECATYADFVAGK
ncbi:hypothetical protein LX87_02039 [Larkinella arboricola]|uniref:Uncharacterized protein n=1 Tax=Larkinella arboricola TaxID=643671 RepID=A0A327X9J1_LARAB|nr:hypothetical protein [Larkinella arboricola]RAK00337.1 hypothetical protein LX87_02039 [Larkinella arboricola]